MGSLSLHQGFKTILVEIRPYINQQCAKNYGRTDKQIDKQKKFVHLSICLSVRPNLFLTYLLLHFSLKLDRKNNYGFLTIRPRF